MNLLAKTLTTITLAILSLLLITNLGSANDRKIELTPENSIYLNAPIDEVSVKFVIESHLKLSKKDNQLYLVINSPGGSIVDGLELIQYLKSTSNITIICKFCASMAFMIFESHENKRLVLQTSVLMGHRAKGGFSGQFEDGEVEKKLEFWKSLVRQIEEVVADRIGLSLENYKAKIKDEWWTYGNEILKQNQADEMIVLTCSASLINSVEETKEESIFGTITFKTSKCPLIPYSL